MLGGRMLGGARRGRRTAPPRKTQPGAAGEHHHDRDAAAAASARARRPSCGAGTRPGSARAPRRTGRSRSACPAASGRASATAAARTPPITMRLVDRRRVDGRGRRDRAVRIRHRPRAVPVLAVVAVAGELAADAPDRVGRGQRRRDDVGELQVELAAVLGPRAARRARRRSARRRRPGRCRRTAGRRSRRCTRASRRRSRRSARRRPSRRRSRRCGRAPSGAWRPASPRPGTPAPEAEPERLDRQAEDVDLGLHSPRRATGSSWGSPRTR